MLDCSLKAETEAISTSITAVSILKYCTVIGIKIAVHITEVVLYCVMPIGRLQSVLIPD